MPPSAAIERKGLRGAEMTSLVAWVGVDSRGPSSVYIATDSRITWDRVPHRWEHGRKTYCTSRSAEILGYVGNVFYPSSILPSVVELLDLTPDSASVQARQHEVERLIIDFWSDLPRYGLTDVSIVHATRTGQGRSCEFGVQVLRHVVRTNSWTAQQLPIPTTSGHIRFGDGVRGDLGALGSGGSSVESALKSWKDSDSGGTSRAVFGAFCESLSLGKDPASGGAPQLVGLDRINPAIRYGVRWGDRTYVCGIPMSQNPSLENIKYCYDLFQCVDFDGRLLEGAQRHTPRRKLHQK